MAISDLDIVQIERKSDLDNCNIKDSEMAHAQRKLKESIKKEVHQTVVNHLKAIRLNFMNELVASCCALRLENGLLSGLKRPGTSGVQVMHGQATAHAAVRRCEQSDMRVSSE